MFNDNNDKNTIPIYLDYNASTPPSEKIKNGVTHMLDMYANPSSTHKHGQQANSILEDSRDNISSYLKLDPRKIVFTSGATESNNIIFHSHSGFLISCTNEHPSIVNPLKKKGENGSLIPICANGYIDLLLLEQKISQIVSSEDPRSVLLSLSLVNSVNGAITPVTKIMHLVKKYRILIHWDCTQALGKMDLPMDKLDPDYLVASGHKIGALKGVGLLYYKDKANIKAISYGGGQELGVRSGTENILAINSFSQAVSEINTIPYQDHTTHLMNSIYQQITKEITDPQQQEEIFLFSRYSKLNQMDSISNTLILAMKNKTSAQQFMWFDMANISLSIGTACTSSNINANNWLQPQESSLPNANLSQSILRITIGLQTTPQEITTFTKKWLSLYLS